MNSKLTMVLAGLLIIAALIAGYWGVKLSAAKPVAAPVVTSIAVPDMPEQAEPVVQPLQPLQQLEQAVNNIVGAETTDKVAVVVVAQTLKPYTAITAADLAIEHMSIAPPGSFSDMSVLLEKHKVVWLEVPQGSVLTPTHFEMGGPLSRMIRANERAVALDVDATVAGGGHLMPGDYVDVLVYFRQDESNTDQTAQVVVPAVRLLTIGDTLGLSSQGEPVVVEEELSEEEARRRPPARKEVARTVVLAIPDVLVNRFLLATQVQGGKVRLAARSADERLFEKYLDNTEVATAETEKARERELEQLNRQLFQFGSLALNQTKKTTPATASRRAAGQQHAPAIEIMRGAQVTHQTF